MKRARPVELSSEQRSELERMVISQTIGVRAARRAQIALLAADGLGNHSANSAFGRPIAMALSPVPKDTAKRGNRYACYYLWDWTVAEIA
jgi:hypothetical protein